MGNQPRDIVLEDNFSIRGIINRIRKYEVISSSTTGPSGHHVMNTRISSELEFLAEDGSRIDICFGNLIGRELIGQKVIYSRQTEVVTGSVKTEVGARIANEKTIRETIIPEDKSLSEYSSIDVTYVG